MDQSMIAAARANMGYAALPPGAGARDAEPLDALARAADEFMAELKSAEAQAARAVTGDGDPHDLITAMAESRLAVEATVAVRDRMVEAYQELMRMQV